MEIVKVHGRYQIVLPKKARRSAGISEGDELLAEEENGRIILKKRPKSYTDFTLGLGADIWEGEDAQEYVDRERETWEKRNRLHG